MKTDCYIINLNSKKNKFNKIKNNLNNLKLDLNIIRFEAINSKFAKKNMSKYCSYEAYENINNISNNNILPTYNAVGCAISHYTCWKKLIHSEEEYCFIAEDDIEIVNKNQFIFSINNVLTIIKNSINPIIITFNSVFKGGNTTSINNNNNSIINNLSKETYYLKNNKYIQKLSINQSLYNTHFYLINKKAAQLIVNNILPIKYQIDVQLGLFSYYYLLDIYTIKKSGVIQDNSVSQVQYYFYKKEELQEIFKMYWNIDISNLIFSFLKKRSDLVLVGEDNYYLLN